MCNFVSKSQFVSELLTITWDVGKGIPIGGFTLRFYQLLFASGFILGYYIMLGFLKREGLGQELLDKLLTYMVIATIIGARLGHVFFYQWDYYSQHPADIFKVWEGGLASHGAAIAIIIGMYIFSKRVSKRSSLWILDKVVVTVALAGCLIRMGNFFNSEIYGQRANSAIETVYTDLPRQALLKYPAWEKYLESVEFESLGTNLETDSIRYPEYRMSLYFSGELTEEQVDLVTRRQINYLNGFPREDENIFVQYPSGELPEFSIQGDPASGWTAQLIVQGVPRYPTQLIEAFGYLLVFIILYLMYVRDAWKKEGLLFGSFLVLVFGFRFFVEFLKVVQVEAEKDMSYNLGQSLSIPLVIVGLFFIIRALRQKSLA